MEEWDCRSGQPEVPPDPPYELPAVLIDFEWEEQDAIRMTLRAPHPGGPEPGDGTTNRTNGCVPGSRYVCWEDPPLIFTEAELPSGYPIERRPGTYALMAEVSEPCMYSDAAGELDAGRLAAVYGHSGFDITVTITQCEAGGPCETVETIRDRVPMPPKGTVYTGNMAPPEYQRVLGTFDWDPATGVSSFVVAPPASYEDTSADASAHDAAEADSGSSEPDEAAEHDDAAEVTDDPPDDVSVARPSGETSDELIVVLAALLVDPDKVLEWLLTGGLREVVDRMNAGRKEAEEADALDPEGLEADAAMSDDPQPWEITSDGPPDTKLKQGRRWVQAGDGFSVRHDGETRELSPTTWYQVKEVDGKYRFFDQDGRLLGSATASGPDAPLLWFRKTGSGDPSADVPAAADGSSDGPPDTKLKQGRRWVQAGDGFSVRHDGETRELSPTTWYQVKEVDGKYRFFDQDGRLLGSATASGPDAPLLWFRKTGSGDPSADQPTAADGTTQPSLELPVPGYEQLTFKPATATDLVRLLFAYQALDERLPQAQREKAAFQLALFDQILLERDPGLSR